MGKNKIKTHQETAKRFRKTGSGIIMQTKGHQSHFRRRRSKRVKRECQRMQEVKSTAHKNALRTWLPNWIANHNDFTKGFKHASPNWRCTFFSGQCKCY